MESSSKKIINIINKILPLLEYAESNYWLKYFSYTITQLNNTSNLREEIKTLSLIFQGGMGSFSDLVLHRNGVPVIEENDLLDDLKEQLYEACKENLRVKASNGIRLTKK